MKTIPLTKGFVAIVDDNDYWDYAIDKWHYSYGYAVRRCTINNVYLRMHREIMGVSGKQDVDHIDGNGLNNQRSNLRVVTRGQNRQNLSVRQKNNKSGFQGVSWNPQMKKWRAKIGFQGQKKCLGHYVCVQDAARAYDKEAEKLYGPNAKLNFPKPVFVGFEALPMIPK